MSPGLPTPSAGRTCERCAASKSACVCACAPLSPVRTFQSFLQEQHVHPSNGERGRHCHEAILDYHHKELMRAQEVYFMQRRRMQEERRLSVCRCERDLREEQTRRMSSKCRARMRETRRNRAQRHAGAPQIAPQQTALHPSAAASVPQVSVLKASTLQLQPAAGDANGQNRPNVVEPKGIAARATARSPAAPQPLAAGTALLRHPSPKRQRSPAPMVPISDMPPRPPPELEGTPRQHVPGKGGRHRDGRDVQHLPALPAASATRATSLPGKRRGTPPVSAVPPTAAPQPHRRPPPSPVPVMPISEVPPGALPDVQSEAQASLAKQTAPAASLPSPPPRAVREEHLAVPAAGAPPPPTPAVRPCSVPVEGEGDRRDRRALWVKWQDRDGAASWHTVDSVRVVGRPGVKRTKRPPSRTGEWLRRQEHESKTAGEPEPQAWRRVQLLYASGDKEWAQALFGDDGRVAGLADEDGDVIRFHYSCRTPLPDRFSRSLRRSLQHAGSPAAGRSPRKKRRVSLRPGVERHAAPQHANPPASVVEEARRIVRECTGRSPCAPEVAGVIWGGSKADHERLMSAECADRGLAVRKSTVPGAGEGLFVRPGKSFSKGEPIVGCTPAPESSRWASGAIAPVSHADAASLLLPSSADWGHIHRDRVADDIADLDGTLVGDPKCGNTARWFYTRAAQAGVCAGTTEPFFVIPHAACVGTKINDPRLAPGEAPGPSPARVANTAFAWHDNVALGEPYRVVISASEHIPARRSYQELFTDYGPNFDFSI